MAPGASEMLHCRWTRTYQPVEKGVGTPLFLTKLWGSITMTAWSGSARRSTRK